MRDRRPGPGPALCLLLALVLLPSFAPTGSADVERRSTRDFHQRARVEGVVDAGGAYAILLDHEAVSALDGEVRLFDASGLEIPSLLTRPGAASEVVERPASIFNRGWQSNGTQTLSVELTDRLPQTVDEFVVEIAEPEYHLLVRVEGSDDGDSWQILADGLHLIRHVAADEGVDYVHDLLHIPTARFRYYRFTLVPLAPVDLGLETGDAGPLEIRDVEVREVLERGDALEVPVGLEPFEDPHDDDTRHDYWRVDLPHDDLGVDRLTLSIAADDYARPASLWEWSEARDRRTRRLARTVLFHYGDDVHTRFSGFRTDARQLVVMIDQGDDAPVIVSDAHASRPRQELRFLAPAGFVPPLEIYLDPDHPRPPRYDLARRLRENEVRDFVGLSHDELEPNPDYSEPAEPRSEQVPYLLYLLVLVLVAGLGAYVARTIRRGLPEEPPSDPPRTE